MFGCSVRGLDTWFSYLRTRESILRKHYLDTGILLSSSRGIMSDRQLTDNLLTTLKPLSEFGFKLDLLFECRQLHRSLMQLEVCMFFFFNTSHRMKCEFF